MASPVVCAACGGFVVDPAAPCLHCDALPPRPRRLARFLATVLLGVGATMTLMACYGAMPDDYDYNDCYNGGWCPDAGNYPDAEQPDAFLHDAQPAFDAEPPDAEVPCDTDACACAALDQAACVTSDVCDPTYAGVHCTASDGGTCTPDDCSCESYEYAGCVATPVP